MTHAVAPMMTIIVAMLLACSHEVTLQVVDAAPQLLVLPPGLHRHHSGWCQHQFCPMCTCQHVDVRAYC